MILTEHIDQLLRQLSGKPVSPALYERVYVTRALFGGTYPDVRSVAAPVFVTDLGVRYFHDPGTFYGAHAKNARIDRIKTSALIGSLEQIEISKLGCALDAVVLFFGDYEAATRVVESRISEILSWGSFDLLIAAGTIAAAVGNNCCLKLYDRATLLAPTISDAYGAQHRAAAFELKRQEQPISAQKRLTLAREKYIDCASQEGATNLSLFHNLMALVVLDISWDSSLKHLKLAIDALSQSAPCTKDLDSRRRRYESQIAINLAQLHVQRGEHSQAWSILKENLLQLKEYCYDYVPEALAELAYLSFLNGEFEMAVDAGSDAFWRYHNIGAVGAMRSTREIIAASLLEMGFSERAERMAELAEQDILGCEGLYGL